MLVWLQLSQAFCVWLLHCTSLKPHTLSFLKPAHPVTDPLLQIFASKFGCVWFLQLGEHSEVVLPWWRKRIGGAARCRLVSELDEMREIVRKGAFCS